MALEAIPGVLFNPVYDSPTDRWAQHVQDLNNLLSTVLQQAARPSATINTAGAALTLSPSGQHYAIRPFSIHGTMSGMAPGEVITFNLTGQGESANKATTQTVSGNGPFTITNASLKNMQAATAGRLTGLQLTIQSSIANSTAVANVTMIGLHC